MSVLVTGCANYRASCLENLSTHTATVYPLPENQEVRITAKTFSKTDCKKYLDRDVIAKGYRPVQLQIENTSDSDYFFSLARVSMPCATPEQVADAVHTSTVGRAVGYGVAAVFTCGLFAIPAVVDGCKSAKANEQLDHDFLTKTARDQVIAPHSRVNMLMFVPKSCYQKTFSLSLIDQSKHKIRSFQITPV